MTNELTPQEDKLPKAIKLLLWLSFGLWIYSLFGVGFDSGGKAPEYGLYILTFGSLLGWLGCSPFPTGCAVYANYFYIFALYRLAFGTKIPTVSTTIMLLLASLTFFLKEVLVNEAGWTTDIDTWGWGAIWWGLSLITLTIATYTKSGKIPLKKSLSITAIIYSVVVFPLIALFLYQYNVANDNEKARYFIPGLLGINLTNYDREKDIANNKVYSIAHIFFSGGTAFVVNKNAFSHIKYTMPPELPNAVLQVNGDIDFSSKWSLMLNDFQVGLPYDFVYNGKLYQKQDEYHYLFANRWDASLIKITPFNGHIDYTINLSQLNDNKKYRFTINNEDNKQIVYQTDMITRGYKSSYPFKRYTQYKYLSDKPTTPLDNEIVVSEKCTQKNNMIIFDDKVRLFVNNHDYLIIPSQEKVHKLKDDFSQYKIGDLYCSEQLAILPIVAEDFVYFLAFDKRNMQVVMDFEMKHNEKSNDEETKNITRYILENIANDDNQITFTYDYKHGETILHHLRINTPIGEIEVDYYRYNHDYKK
ncbi:MAG: hypothetical protein IKX14_04150 [Neisseriaceae bacterium]|nr:hypothetical protein [Neisseriaceae bacterium]